MIVIGWKLARPGLEGKRVHKLESAGRQQRQGPGKERPRDAASSPRRGDDEADDDRRFERLAWKRRGCDAQPTEAMREQVSCLGIEPADDLVVTIREESLHCADLDSRLHCYAVVLRRQRRPIDLARHLIEMAIALRPFRIVGKC